VKWLAWSLFVYCCSLLATLPASLGLAQVAPQLAAALPYLAGTVWRGNGIAPRNAAGLHEFGWTTDVGSLWSGCWIGDLTFSGRGQTQARLCNESFELSELQMQFPVAQALPALQMPASIAAGRVAVSVDNLNVSADMVVASGRIIWRDAFAGLGQAVDLGTVEAQLRGLGKSLILEVKNADSELLLDLKIAVTTDKTYQMRGTIEPTGSLVNRNDFALFGERLANGRIVVRQAGVIAL
jgi:hypothetical protein